MAKYNPSLLTNLDNQVSAVATINLNLTRISTALEQTLSRDGTVPNEMNTDLDMNDHRIYNLPEPVGGTEPLRRKDADEILGLVDEFQAVIDATKGVLDAYADLQATYLGDHTTLPVTDNLGNPLVDGAMVSLVGQTPSTDNGLYIYHNGVWGPAGVLPSAFERVKEVFTTAGQTIVAIPGGYTVGTSKFFRNGVLLKQGSNLGVGDLFDDVTASNGVDLVFPGAVLLLNDRITALISTPYAIVTPPAAINVGFTPAGTVAATNVQAAIEEVSTEAALKTVTVTGGGLATGGGALSSNQIITVTKSSNAQALAGVDDTTAMTPVRVKDAIAAAGGSPAQTLVNSGTTSAVASLDIPLTGSFRKYQIHGEGFEPASANQALLVRFSFDGGATYLSGASAYLGSGVWSDSGGATGTMASSGANAMYLGRNQPTAAAGSELCFTFGIGSATLPVNAFWEFTHTFTGGLLTSLTGGYRVNSAPGAATHVRLLYASGNIGAGAKWELYGLRN